MRPKSQQLASRERPLARHRQAALSSLCGRAADSRTCVPTEPPQPKLDRPKVHPGSAAHPCGPAPALRRRPLRPSLPAQHNIARYSTARQAPCARRTPSAVWTCAAAWARRRWRCRGSPASRPARSTTRRSAAWTPSRAAARWPPSARRGREARAGAGRLPAAGVRGRAQGHGCQGAGAVGGRGSGGRLWAAPQRPPWAAPSAAPLTAPTGHRGRVRAHEGRAAAAAQP
jgi:hypothetical protein